MKTFKSFMAVILCLIMTTTIFACSGDDNGDKDNITGDVTAQFFSDSTVYNVGEEISISFANKFNNTTGLALSYTASIGNINSSGLWTYTPLVEGEFSVSIEAAASSKSARINFTLNAKVNREVLLFAKPYVQTNIYRPGENISIDLSEHFTNETDETLALSSSFGNLSSEGIWSFTPDKAGCYSTEITMTAGQHTEIYPFSVSVQGTFNDKQDIIFNDQPFTIGNQVYQANEVASFQVNSVTTNLIVPSAMHDPVLLFYYRGASNPRINITAKNLITNQEHNIRMIHDSQGRGMGVSSTVFETEFMIYRFDLNFYFELDESTEFEFKFQEASDTPRIDKFVKFAGVNVYGKNAIPSFEGPLNLTWNSINTCNDNTITQLDNSVVRIEMKGVTNPDENTYFALTSGFIASLGATRNYKINIKGNGDFRAMIYRIDQVTHIGSRIKFMSNHDVGVNEYWQTATAQGFNIWDETGSNPNGQPVYIIVNFRSKTTDTWIEISAA